MQQIPLVGAPVLAALYQSHLAASFLRLFVAGYGPTPGDTLADLEAVEATYSGYPTGGYPITAWSAPQYPPEGGAQTVSAQVEASYTPPGSGSGVSNSIGGWFLVDSAGNLVADGSFTSPIVLQQQYDGFPITVSLIVGTQAALVNCWVYGQQQP